MKEFVKPLDHYKRRIDLIADYVADSARYLSLMTGDPLEQTRAFVVKSITTGKRALKIPRAQFLQRNAVGDRSIQQLPFNQYLSRAIGNNEIMAPTMTTYLPTTQKQSLLAIYIDGNLTSRDTAKHAMFQAEMNGLKALMATYDSQQSTFKIKNNALSGAHCSPFTPLWNKSAHSTLTSVCRSATSYANANNEKFLYGNRHYYSPDVIKANIISIVNHSDLAAFERVMAAWQLRHPTVEETMGCVRRGSHAYWRNPEQLQIIEAVLTALQPVERSAFLYTNDLYHLSLTNPDFVHELLRRLAVKATDPILDTEVAKAALKGMDDNMKAFVSILCADELKGKDTKALLKRVEAGEEGALHDCGIVAATAVAKKETIEAYGDFIQTFWVTDNLPSSVFSIPGIIRRGVLTSDTDSTIFTVQTWVEWQHGKIDFSPEAIATANSVVYLAGQLVRHILATLCGNMGVEPHQILRLEMKNEYYFPVFLLTSRAKHYYAYMAAREGLVFQVMKHEIKGVALRSSAVAEEIIELSHATMFGIMDAILKGDQIELLAIVRRVATIEREVLAEVQKGSFEFFKKTRIQDRSAYKADNGGNFMHYELWEEAFASKYGHAPEPPYQAIKASLTTGKKGAFQQWLTDMPDPEIAGRIKAWAERTGKLYIGTFYMPAINLIAHGVPSEISMVVDTRSLVAQLMESFYLILEGLGVYARNKKITRLISDDRTILSLPEGVLKKTA